MLNALRKLPLLVNGRATYSPPVGFKVCFVLSVWSLTLTFEVV